MSKWIIQYDNGIETNGEDEVIDKVLSVIPHDTILISDSSEFPNYTTEENAGKVLVIVNNNPLGGTRLSIFSIFKYSSNDIEVRYTPQSLIAFWLAESDTFLFRHADNDNRYFRIAD